MSKEKRTEYAIYRASAVALGELDAHFRAFHLRWAPRTLRQRAFIRSQIRQDLAAEIFSEKTYTNSYSPGLKRLAQAIHDALDRIDPRWEFGRADKVGMGCVNWFTEALQRDIPYVNRHIGHHVAALREHFDATMQTLIGAAGEIDVKDHLDALDDEIAGAAAIADQDGHG